MPSPTATGSAARTRNREPYKPEKLKVPRTRLPSMRLRASRCTPYALVEGGRDG